MVQTTREVVWVGWIHYYDHYNYNWHYSCKTSWIKIKPVREERFPDSGVWWGHAAQGEEKHEVDVGGQVAGDHHHHHGDVEGQVDGEGRHLNMACFIIENAIWIDYWATFTLKTSRLGLCSFWTQLAAKRKTTPKAKHCKNETQLMMHLRWNLRQFIIWMYRNIHRRDEDKDEKCSCHLPCWPTHLTLPDLLQVNLTHKQILSTILKKYLSQFKQNTW